MELNKKTIIEIFRKNFAFPIVETVLGSAIKMDALSAFYFANVTGAGYIDNETYPFTPKGTTKILREAFQYNVVTGIFDKAQFFYSPLQLVQSKPYLFEGDKFVILDEGMNEADFRTHISDSFKILEKNKLISTDYLLLRIEKWKNGNGMEPILEYLACEYFKNKKYIVENQIPLVHSVGTPDFGGFHVPLASKGFHIIELAMVRITGDVEILDELNVEHAIVGEAKTSTTVMARQLEKYLNTSPFLKGYELHPEKNLPTKDCFGLLNIREDYTIRCIDPLKKYTSIGSQVFDFNEYKDWYQNYLKFYIIANFTNEELREFVEKRKVKGKYSIDKIVEVVKNISTEEIVKCIKEVM